MTDIHVVGWKTWSAMKVLFSANALSCQHLTDFFCEMYTRYVVHAKTHTCVLGDRQ